MKFKTVFEEIDYNAGLIDEARQKIEALTAIKRCYHVAYKKNPPQINGANTEKVCKQLVKKIDELQATIEKIGSLYALITQPELELWEDYAAFKSTLCANADDADFILRCNEVLHNNTAK